MQKVIHVNNAEIKTVSVEIKKFIVDKKQVTLSLARQIPEENIFTKEFDLVGVPWVRINYFFKDAEDAGDTLHIIWQKNSELRRCLVHKPQAEWDGTFTSAEQGNNYYRSRDLIDKYTKWVTAGRQFLEELEEVVKECGRKNETRLDNYNEVIEKAKDVYYDLTDKEMRIVENKDFYYCAGFDHYPNKDHAISLTVRQDWEKEPFDNYIDNIFCTQNRVFTIKPMKCYGKDKFEIISSATEKLVSEIKETEKDLLTRIADEKAVQASCVSNDEAIRNKRVEMYNTLAALDQVFIAV